MMDIVPELLQRIESQYIQGIRESKKLEAIREKINKKNATYLDADEYAKEVADILAAAYDDNITEEVLPNGTMYYNIASRVLEPTIKTAYEEISDVVMKIQTLLNEKASIGLKAVKPELNWDRVDGIINKLSNEE